MFVTDIYVLILILILHRLSHHQVWSGGFDIVTQGFVVVSEKNDFVLAYLPLCLQCYLRGTTTVLAFYCGLRR